MRRDDSEARSEAARALNRARWGTRRVDGLVRELEDRADELGTRQLSRLAALVEPAAAGRKEQSR